MDCYLHGIAFHICQPKNPNRHKTFLDFSLHLFSFLLIIFSKQSNKKTIFNLCMSWIKNLTWIEQIFNVDWVASSLVKVILKKLKTCHFEMPENCPTIRHGLCRQFAGKNLGRIFWLILDTFGDFLHSFGYFWIFLDTCMLLEVIFWKIWYQYI